MAHTAYLGLGANLGDAAATLHAVLDELARTPGIGDLAASSLYRSAPVDAGGPDYVNGVARIATTLAPLDLLDCLQAMELRHGRERPYRHAPRTLDLDLLLYDEQTIDHPRLIVPHPRMRERAFVLAPLRELAPGLVLAGRPVGDWLADCAGQRVDLIPNA